MCVLGWIVKSESLYNVLVCMHLQAGVCVCILKFWLTFLNLLYLEKLKLGKDKTWWIEGG